MTDRRSSIDDLYRRGLQQMVAPGAPEPRKPRSGPRNSRAAGAFAAVVLLAVGAAATVIVVTRHREPTQATSNVTNTVVPWAALSVPPTPAPTSTTEIACTASDLQATPLQFAGFAAGTVGFSGTLTLISGSRCSVPSTVNIAFFDQSGAPIDIGPSASNTSTAVDFSPATPQASVALEISGWCTSHVPSRANLALAAGSPIEVAIATPPVATQPCPELGAATYSLDISASMPSAPTPSPTSSLPAYSVSINALATASPGQHYGYQVTIANASAQPLTLLPCPAYDEGLKTLTGFSVSYELNCAAAKVIPVGGSEIFQMYIDVPATAESGVVVLTWGIEDTSSSIAASAPLTISG